MYASWFGKKITIFFGLLHKWKFAQKSLNLPDQVGGPKAIHERVTMNDKTPAG